MLACVLFAVASAADSAPPKILIIGDSLSAAHGIALEDSWVALLEARLAEHGYPHEVVNASVGGETSGGGLRRLPRALERHEPTVVVIELGGNDGLRRIPVETLRDNLSRMIEKSRDTGAEVLLLGVTLPRNYGPAYIEAFDAVFPDLAAQYGIESVDFFLDGVALNAEKMQRDGIHPNERAQPRMLDNVWPALEPLLER